MTDKDILIQTTPEFILASDTPLPLFADMDEVEATRDMLMPNMWPVSPVIDLIQEHVYVRGKSTGTPSSGISIYRSHLRTCVCTGEIYRYAI